MIKRLNKKQGFSLVEIFVVSGITFIIAALAIFSLLRGRVLANDSVARNSVQSIAAAMELYKTSNDAVAGALNILTNANPPFLSDNFSDSEDQGYRFRIIRKLNKRFALLAQPLIPGITGTKYICYAQGDIKEFSTLADAEAYVGEDEDEGGGPIPVVCGNGICQAGESCANCAADCGGCPPGGGGCFLSDTPILMSDGSFKPIQDIVAGDKIIAFDEQTGEFKPDSVVKLITHEKKENEYLIINGHLKVTGNHPVYSNGKWLKIGTLYIGDNLLNSQGKIESITSIKQAKEPVLVYNLEVNPYHTYIAGGIVAHNGYVGDEGGPIKKHK